MSMATGTPLPRAWPLAPAWTTAVAGGRVCAADGLASANRTTLTAPTAITASETRTRSSRPTFSRRSVDTASSPPESEQQAGGTRDQHDDPAPDGETLTLRRCVQAGVAPGRDRPDPRGVNADRVVRRCCATAADARHAAGVRGGGAAAGDLRRRCRCGRADRLG